MMYLLRLGGGEVTGSYEAIPNAYTVTVFLLKMIRRSGLTVACLSLGVLLIVSLNLLLIVLVSFHS